ncbi:acyl-CoA dehydrogenase family protein [Brevibacillus porteri]|uniref:Acyl-CoA dehydrogenase n=1 Tax=Brevibacillus porteri TaxID=2126350 RepID=A0ABX5FXA5_9BACL|nr:acyl-CoA dehydrogenase family protein [Brevibacillus porteri]MED1798859.1 acyl-CoA dehydrogenase family protein [Brevibacillus porteri]MED2131542.1 acyl-CoA dehydrogenase family protein [Brevibacillus porteri]MED2744095.1 acyl-CoA dehydrogenase family protein [Brevibacillus porteri]MED2813309.1 acyl-CoA dehydrogenase family protein [Brevibacillus porteri]MED2896627.1 acyl-CoA dehydrogenase family protein [Brevibacillus porteri]
MKQTELRWNQLFLLQPEEYVHLFTPEDFTEEEQLISKTTERFVKKEVASQLTSIEQQNHEATCTLFEKAGELGLLGIEVPEAYGGLSLNKKVAGLVAEKMGFGGSFSVSYNIHAGVGTLPYVYFASEEQKRKYLPKLASGEWIGAYALTESGAGSDALSAKTSAVRSEDGTEWLLNGEKQWITNAQVADVYVVFANTSIGMTAFIVERSFDGVSVGPEEKKMGIKGSSTATLILDQVRIPNNNVLGTAGVGHRIALNILNMARLKLAFSNIGAAKQALELAVNYGTERKQFRKELVEFTMIQEKIANMTTAIYGAESAAYRTAGALDDVIESFGTSENKMEKIADYAMECAINKINSSEVLDAIVDEAVQIHGGYGYMQEYEVERLYRDARISRIFEGTNEINRLTVSKILVKKFMQQKSTMMEPESVVHAGRNEAFIQLSKRMLYRSLDSITHSSLKIEEEQEYMRLLADIIKDIYVMESALLRMSKGIAKNGVESGHMKQLVTDVLCEEGYRRVQESAVSIISGAATDEQNRKRLLDEIRHLPAPLYTNLFIKKRAIAKEVIKRTHYFV